MVHFTEFLTANFKNDPEYLMRGTLLVFILLMRFLQRGLFSRRFLVRLRYAFLVFPFHFRLYDVVDFWCSHVLVILISFVRSGSFLTWQLYPYRYFFHTLHYEYGAISMPNSIPISWLYILTGCICFQFSPFLLLLLL